MKYSPNVVLELPLSANADLRAFVEKAISDGVDLIAVCGDYASAVEDRLDWLIVEIAESEAQWIVTTSHAAVVDPETEETAFEFAQNWKQRGHADVVTL